MKFSLRRLTQSARAALRAMAARFTTRAEDRIRSVAESGIRLSKFAGGSGNQSAPRAPSLKKGSVVELSGGSPVMNVRLGWGLCVCRLERKRIQSVKYFCR